MNGTISTIVNQGSITMDRQGSAEGREISTRRARSDKPHHCDGCGEVGLDVELFAEESQTGEELWLCEACGV
jgi:hypothetical protein